MASLPNWNVNGEKKMKEAKTLQDEESFSHAMQICSSVALSIGLETAMELGVFDVLQKAGDAAKLSAKEIASEVSCNNPEAPEMLDRVLALLTSHNILNCSLIPDNLNLGSFHRLYSFTPVATFFARNADGVSLAPFLTMVLGTTFRESGSKLKDAIREGGIPFNLAHGTQMFECLSLDSRFNQIFNTAMVNHTTLVMKKVLECYKGFDDIKRLVDIGGGLGININMITSKYPHIQGINFDLPHVLQHAPSYPGVEHVSGNMFESVPNGDAIFMKWILHDWTEEYCLKLLKNCYDAIPDDGKVIVVEAVLQIMPETNAAWKAASQLDVGMMTLLKGGKERNEQEFMKLATGAGFSGIRYICCVGPFWVMEFIK